jgi:Ca2+-binding EF-hand superfamily protein
MHAIVFVLAGMTLAAEQPAPLRPVPGDAQDLVLFLDARPYLIRLHLQIDGRSFRGNWDESIGHLFRYLDVDGDSSLSKKEAELAPSKTQWVQLMTGTTLEPDAAPEFGELSGGAGNTKVTEASFARYYRHSGAGALQVEWGYRSLKQDRLSDALWGRLDKDKDGTLSRAELLAAESALHALDTNEDDLIDANELSPNGGYPMLEFRTVSGDKPAPHNFPIAVLHADGPAKELAGKLLGRYDGNKDRHLNREELPLEKAAFDRLDANRDGRLNAAELAGWRALPPDLELIAPLEKGSRKDLLLLPPAESKTSRLAALLSPSRDGAVRIPLADNQLELVREQNGWKRSQELLKQFDAAADKDGFLPEKRIYQPPFTFVALLRLADRNGDNRLSRAELKHFLEVQDKFLFRTSYLTLVDRGSSLFEFFDADHDGRLSPRELCTVWQRLSPWDRGQTGRIARRQVPRQFQLILSYGLSRASLSNLRPGYLQLLPFRDRSRGPLWFRKMDRNGDGDLSRREFLGTAEQFRRIDANGDGLIDVGEAERADKALRKRP